MADLTASFMRTQIIGSALFFLLFFAVILPHLDERQRRLARLRRGVEREDITWWLRRQLEDLAEIAGGR